MHTFIDKINETYPLSQPSVDLLLSHLREHHYRKGHLLVQEGGPNDQVYFMQQGLARAFVSRDGKEYTMWFATQGDPLVMTIGGTAPQRSMVSIDLLEDSTILSIKRSCLEELVRTSLELCNWSRISTDRYLCSMEEFLTTDLCASASERYERLLREAPEMVHKIPLKYLASYLLITPESLSRIRGKITTR